METLAVSLGEKSYHIYIKDGILADLAAYSGTADKWFILTDENLDRLYGTALAAALEGLPYAKFVLPPGETSKSFHTVETIIDAMLAAGLTRHSAIIAFGGGVVGDLAGFCASIYMRGIRYLQIPTTLLAQVDSSVGGKTGINVSQGKNMAGTFYQPQVVLIDTGLLATLPQREFTAGLGEVIKYGLIYDYQFLQHIKNNFVRFCNLDFAALNSLIRQCCQIKASIVGQDETERDLRKILNFGHTIGHALETLTHYQRYLHGEAVLIGMHYESLLAKKMNLISEAYSREIADLIGRTNISADLRDFSLTSLVEQMRTDKKNQDGVISFILPTGLGQVTEYTMTPQQTLTLLSS